MIHCRPVEAFAPAALRPEPGRHHGAVAAARWVAQAGAVTEPAAAPPAPAVAPRQTRLRGFPLGFLLSVGLWALILAPFLVG